ncbi:hypothetical protein HID58_078660 [Brassica napus]|uniref:FAE domain-containing protein n=1 Tax=Brassica napus TaxID=3708 RepID=A0ABQ7YUR4_BRANA|nr:hypothetical protein HID58_078660 [Brassica napus]
MHHVRVVRESDKWGKTDENDYLMDFVTKILERSGLGQETYVPEGLHCLPVEQTMAGSRKETEEVIIGAVDNLFHNTGISPSDIGILVVNSSTFNPTPSAGVIAVDVAKSLLQVHRNTYALVVSTENITQNLYVGNNTSMLVTNCLFRVGGAAVLLSNLSKDRKPAKYQLVHTVRVHSGADDRSYGCATQEEDEDGVVGVTLSKDLPTKFLNPKIKHYMPDFKLAFEHFCIHAGGRALIDELEKNLHLSVTC